MTKSRVSSASAVVLCAVVVVLITATVSEAVTCNPGELNPCAAAISSSQNPSAACCNKLREQRPCLCGYLRNPALKQYVNSPGARRVVNYCRVPIPSC